MKSKTIAMIKVNRNGLWVDNLESIFYEREIKVRPGAWVGQMQYEKEDEEWKPVSVIITHGSALTMPSDKWEQLPKVLHSGKGYIGVRDLEGIRKVNVDSEGDRTRKDWVEKVVRGIGKRHFAEFDNFFAFRAPENILIHPSILKNRNHDVVAVALMFGEKVEVK